jgi:hypothetical protein
MEVFHGLYDVTPLLRCSPELLAETT